jgi:hypothetical protein
MKLSFAVVLLALALALPSCRDYDLESHLTDQSGLVPPERFARYGREQAEVMAIAREYGDSREGSPSEDRAGPVEATTGYARTLPDVADVAADPLGFRLTVRFKSGWLTMATPVADGKRGAETVGVPAQAGSGTRR